MPNEQLQKAIEAIKGGEKNSGKLILYKLVKDEPGNELAWMWLSACIDDNNQKIKCLEKVIEINPNNEKARIALQRLKSVISEPDISAMITNSGNGGVGQLSSQLNDRINNPRSIEFIPANCPNCGGELRVPADKAVVKCMYCGHDVLIHDPNNINVNLQLKIDISKPLKLAQVAEQGKNYEDGYKYYSQVLEQDAENIAAWMGRARCAAWRGSVQSQTLEEAVSYIKTAYAIKQLDREDLNFTIWHIASATSVYATQVGEYLTSEQNQKTPRQSSPDGLMAMAVAFGAANVQKQINNKFIEMYFPPIFHTLYYCWGVAPTQNVGASIYNTISNMRHVSVLSSETMQYIDENLQKIVDDIKLKHPNLPPPEKRKSCFIATATLGDIDHPLVETLRQFRDHILAHSFLGRKFIDLYYRYSPPIAELISRHFYLTVVLHF